MSIEIFKEIAKLKEEESALKVVFDQKRKRLKEQERNTIEAAFRTYFISNGFNVTSIAGKLNASIGSENIVLEYSHENTMSLVHGSLTVGKSSYSFWTQREGTSSGNSFSFGPQLSKEQEEINTLKRNIEGFKEYNSAEHTYSYVLKNNQAPRYMITSNPHQVREDKNRPKAYRTFEDLLAALFVS